MSEHPMQSIQMDECGIPRFKGNAVIEWICNVSKIDIKNIIHNVIQAERMHFIPHEDLIQFFQLRGMSLTEYRREPSVTADDVKAAENAWAATQAKDTGPIGHAPLNTPMPLEPRKESE